LDVSAVTVADVGTMGFDVAFVIQSDGYEQEQVILMRKPEVTDRARTKETDGWAVVSRL